MTEPTHYNESAVTCDGTASVLLSNHIDHKEGTCIWSVEVKDYEGNLVHEFIVRADNIELVRL